MWWGRSNPPSAVNGLGISPLSQGHIISSPPITFSLFLIFQSIMSYDSCIWRHLIKLFLMKEIHAIVFLITTKTSLDFFVWYYLLLFFLYFMFCLCSIIKSTPIILFYYYTTSYKWCTLCVHTSARTHLAGPWVW